MFQFPELPPVWSVSQIECVSCRELFAINEGEFASNRRPAENHIMNNGLPDSHLRFQPNRQLVQTTPPLRTEPRSHVSHPLPNNQTVRVNCPRCGTDNRNWINIMHNRRFRSNFAPNRVGFVGMAFVLLLTLTFYIILERLDYTTTTTNILLFISLFLVGFAVLLSLPNEWRDLLEHRYFNQVLNNGNSILNMPPSVRKLFWYLLATAVFLPLILFVGMPALWTFLTYTPPAPPEDILQNIDELATAFPRNAYGLGHVEEAQAAMDQLHYLAIINGPKCESARLRDITEGINRFSMTGISPQVASELRLAHQSLFSLMQQERFFCTHSNFTVAHNALERAAFNPNFCTGSCLVTEDALNNLLSDVATLLPAPLEGEYHVNLNDAGARTAVFNDVAHVLSQQPSAPLTAQIEQQLITIATWIDEASVVQPQFSFRFLLYWSLMASAVVTIAGGIALFGQQELLRELTDQLPRPIYFSIANMSRVVVWEAKRALEIDHVADRIQWTAVQRNPDCGITLTGMIREVPYRENGRLQTTVNAQRYVITTDRWGYIVNAEIIDCRSHVPPGSAIPATATDLFSAIQTGRIIK